MREHTGSVKTAAADSGVTHDAEWWMDERGMEKQRQRHSDSGGSAGGFRPLGDSRPRPQGGL
jgi:hypothetical protein